MSLWFSQAFLVQAWTILIKVYSNVYKGNTVSFMWIFALTPLPTPLFVLYPCPAPSLCLAQNKQKILIWIPCHRISGYSLTVLPTLFPHPPSSHKTYPGFTFIFKIHLLESFKLELCDLNVRIFHTWTFLWHIGLGPSVCPLRFLVVKLENRLS